ncbi:MFS transporter [Mycolicibacter sp. MYC123]|uniref:MFS-type drug efflux transporter P55 n=1 Tax=[Mycobacterium] zoologicum TaxID=2872311 RepID=A0ABU5YF51_9MYCO|nr:MULTISPECIES: MFS transporter [unclassified Mycolicibacter]MEB3048662.1 MFS transporter [Mycolicibacter sp. MYC123]MEB3063092.1 MFS transporter [Mycolicibacter sp. MYC101]
MRANRKLAISAGSIAVLLGALDTYVVVTIMRDIMAPQPAGVGIPINKIQQLTPIITCYLLGYIAAMPLLGRASDRFGRKLLLQFSLALFAAGSVVTAMSLDLQTLVIGRTVQGIAAGALLPVTFALGADLWAQRNRSAVLGWIAGAQELGSVLGPLYGIFIVWALTSWRDVFWINVPLTLLAMALIHFSLPSKSTDGPRERVDVVGGLLLAAILGLLTIGLYNPDPSAKQALPDHGLVYLAVAAVALVAFAVWEIKSPTKLIDPEGARFGPFLAALGSSLAAGAALMVTLVDVELFGQGVLGKSQNEAAMLLLWFLIALPIGAVAGGAIATRAGDRVVTFAGLLVAAVGYWFISKWPVDLMSYHHDVFGLSLPAAHTDQLVAGLGLGLVIGPLTSAVMRVVPPREHGIAAAGVVVARMTGMLVGMAALSAWGLYRFNQILAGKTTPNGNLAEKVEAIARNSREAFAAMYGEIFGITALICVAGAVLGLFIGSNADHVSDPETSESQATVPTAG